MRIARVLTRANLGGPARQALASDPVLSARGNVVRQFVGSSEPGEGDLVEEIRARGVEVVRIPGLSRGISLFGDWRAARALAREIAAFEPEVVHTHASKAGALGRRAAWRVRAKCVHTFHGHVLEGYFSPRVSRLLVAQERRAAARTDRILAVAHATADDLVRLGVCGEEKLVVVPPGIDLAPLLAIRGRSGALRGPLGVSDGRVLVGVVGRLAEVKRPELAIEVFGLLAERYPALELCFVGDGALRGMLERRIASGSAAVRERVHMAGARSDMTEVLADLDVVLLTSRNEGAPVALIEAAAAGLPVVATAVGGVPEIVAHERTGFLGSDATELAFGLAQLLDHPELRASMGARARVRGAARHSAEALADRLEAVYRAVLEEGACAS